MALTSPQIDQFQRDGYLDYGSLLEPEEVNVLLAHLMDLFVEENVRDNMAVRRGSDGVLDLCNLLQGIVDRYPGTMAEPLATAIEHARTAAVVLGEAEARGEITYKQVDSADRFLQVRNVHEKDAVFADLVRDDRILGISPNHSSVPTSRSKATRLCSNRLSTGASFPGIPTMVTGTTTRRI